MRTTLLGASLLALMACTPAGDAGCATYGLRRPSMPDLPADPLGEWVAVTDSAMTGACR